MQLFYESSLPPTAQEVVFPKKESGHIVKVLRKKQGDTLHVTNGRGILFTAEITDAHPNKCKGFIVRREAQKPIPYHLHIAIAPTKRNERTEWFLEKATEIGITEITPVLCEHSERKKVKVSRYQRVLESAMKQSLQTYLPQLNNPIPFVDFIAHPHSGQKFIAHCEDTEKKALQNELLHGPSVLILIGPEGDFSPLEIDRALAQHFQPVSLGDHRLRTETAALVACHTVSLFHQK